jgi:hypothetical protein
MRMTRPAPHMETAERENSKKARMTECIFITCI